MKRGRTEGDTHSDRIFRCHFYQVLCKASHDPVPQGHVLEAVSKMAGDAVNYYQLHLVTGKTEGNKNLHLERQMYNSKVSQHKNALQP